MRNRLRIRVVLFVTAAYLTGLGYLFLVSPGLMVGTVLYAAIVIAFTYTAYQRELKLCGEDKIEFRKVYPMHAFGVLAAEFQYVYHHEKNILSEVFMCTNSHLSEKMALAPLRLTHIVDIDRNLKHKDPRAFHLTSAPPTVRGSVVTFIYRTDKYGSVQSIRWWILMSGFLDTTKIFLFIAFSPIHIVAWIIAYLRKEYHMINGLRTIYPAYYNDMDVALIIRSMNDTAFDALVSVLDQHGIDTSDLKIQRAQVMNLTVSGGKVDIGNVVQGAMNKVMAKRTKA